jgi:membrane-associated phospholipid phosphatase
MALSYSVFFALYTVTMVVAVFAGLLILVGWKDMYWRKALLSVRYNAVYVILIAAFPLLVQAQDILEKQLDDEGSKTIIYTNWIFSLAGGAIRVVQDWLNYAVLKDFFIIAYAWGFAFITYFAPIILLVKDDRATLRHYAIAMMFNYIVLIPFYLAFPVTVTGSHPDSGMTPLLYASTSWGRMVTSVDPLDNDFPSGHVSLSVTTFLIFAYAGIGYRRLSYFLAGATVAIVFSVLYLGVHWPADVFAGFLLAVGATVAARSDRIQMTIDRYVRIISRKLFREKPEGSSSSPQQGQRLQP